MNLEKRPLIGIPTWNDDSVFYPGVELYGINVSYVSTLRKAGALPILVPLHMDRDSLRGIFDRLDGIFLAGGGDIAPRVYNPKSREAFDSSDIERDITELTLVKWALDANMPVLGVCRGIQIINIACGGTLYHDLRKEQLGNVRHDFIGPEFKRDQISHDVTLSNASYLGNIFGGNISIGVNSMHHQGVAEVGTGLQVNASSADGLTEAVKSTEHSFVLGTQWHPEELMKTDQRHETVFADFLSTAADAWRSSAF